MMGEYMMRINQVVVLLGFGIMVSCTALQTSDPSLTLPPMPDSTGRPLETLIDSTVQGQDRQTLLSVLEKLPEAQRGNVVYINAEGKILATREGVADSVLSLEKVKNDEFTSADNKINMMMPPSMILKEARGLQLNPQSVPSNPCTQDGGATGGWSRSITNPYKNARIVANTFLPSKTQGDIKYFNASTETAYIYSGGWSLTAQGTGIDAGFQHSPTFDNWTPFIRLENAAYIIGYQGILNGVQVSAPRRFKGNSWASLDFKVGVNQVVLSTWGWLDNAAPLAFWEHWWQNQLVVVVDLPPVILWSSTLDVVLKRMTSMAQNQGFTRNGAYIRNSQWTDIKVSQNAGNPIPWTSAQSPSVGWRCGFPANNVSFSGVTITAPINETIAVNLN
jgi:hypothetical protein